MRESFLGPTLLFVGLLLVALLAPADQKYDRKSERIAGPKAQTIWNSMEEFHQEKDADIIWREDLAWRCRLESVSGEFECERKRRRG